MHLWPNTHFTEDSANSFIPKINWNCTLFPISLTEQTSFLLSSDSLEKLQSLGKGLSSKPFWKCHFNTRTKFTTCFKKLQRLLLQKHPASATAYSLCSSLANSPRWQWEVQRDWPHTRNIRGAAAPTMGFQGVQGMESAPLLGSRAVSNSPSSEEKGPRWQRARRN